MATTTNPINRTTVRTIPLAVRATRTGFRVLGPRAPSLAARWAEHLFLSPRRHARPFWEFEALLSAKERWLPYDGGELPMWTWTPPGLGGLLDDPKTVVVLHGWEGRGSQFAAFVPSLLEAGLQVVAFDAPGHGDSTVPRGSVVEHARALARVAEVVGRVHAVIGHSVGGAAALLATRFGLSAERFVLIAPPTTPSQFASSFARALGIDETVKQAMIARIEARYAMPFTDIDARLDASRLESSLLVVHDQDDPVVSVVQGRTLAELAPRGSMMETSGLGHRAILRAGRVVEAATDFVREGLPTATFAETLEGELFLREKRWSRLARV